MLLNEHQSTIDACRFCFMCSHVCTLGVVSGKESDTPRGKGLILFKILRGHVEYSPELVETLYRCCLCGMCEAWCKAKCTPPAAVLAARADIVAQGREPQAAQQIKANLLKTGNPFGLPGEDRFKAVDTAGVVRDRAEVLYYVGCDTAYQRPEIANAFLKILRQAKVDAAVLRDEHSTGKPLWLLGHRDEARAMAESLLRKVRKMSDDAGFYRYPLPKKYGGRDGTNLGMAIIREHLAANGLGLHCDLQNEHSIVSNHVGLLLMIEYGTDAQKEEFLDGLLAGTTGFAFGITEPAHGSDATHMETHAERQGDLWRINGEKTWNTGVHTAPYDLTFARTSSRGHARAGR
jgi:heterodisulfide reductase subunit C